MDMPTPELPVDELDLELILRSLNRCITHAQLALDLLENSHDRR